MLILFILVVGMAAGWVAQLILGRGTNWSEALIAGLLGSIVGGTLGSILTGGGLDIEFGSLIGTVVGALIVLAIWGAVRGRSGRTARR